MLYFREHQWLLVHGASRINAWIDPTDARPDEVRWDLSLNYVAGGAKWRRVKSWNRPRVHFWLEGFQPNVRSWRELEHVDFWDGDPSWNDPEVLSWEGGSLRMEATDPATHGEGVTWNSLHIWRVAARDAGRFTIEMAGFADGDSRRAALAEAPAAVLPDGTEAAEEATAEFWKRNAQFYVIEEIPLGLVSVQVPRNARDPVAQALGRTRTLLGLTEPEHVVVRDFAKRPEPSEFIQNNLYVDLHFHGYYED